MIRTDRKVLVTGVAGFLGSNLLSRLIESGHKVVGIDNLSMGSLQNIGAHLDNKYFQLVTRDITEPSTFADLGADFGYVVHLAAFKIPRYGKTIDTLQINSKGTDNVLDFARKIGCKCVLASTSDVYGRNPRLPFREEDECVLGPSDVARWAYAVSKLFDEHLGFAYQERFGIPVTVLRFFGSYGPNQNISWWGGPQSVFIDAVLKGQEIPIHGDGLQTRSFTYVSDTIDGIYAAMVKAEADGQIFNIGSTQEITIVDLAKMVKRLSNTPGELKLRFIPYESFTGKKYEDVRRRVPDVSRCERVLGVRAKVGLEEGLSRTIEWQRSLTEGGIRPLPTATESQLSLSLQGGRQE